MNIRSDGLCFPSKEGNNGIYFLIYKMLLIKKVF